MAKEYDIIIIGAGPAGMTAALYASRANMSVLMLDRGIYGGQMNNTASIENYPGFKSILGPDLAKEMYDSSTQFGAEYSYGSVESVVNDGDTKTITTDMGDEFITKVLIIGTGSEYKKLGVPGEEDFSGRGVSYCAVCDGAFFKGMHLVVIGGGDSAIEEGIYLTQLASKVTVIHRRDQLRAQKITQQRAFDNDKMEFVWNSNVTEIVGDDKVEGVKVNNNKTGEDSFIDASGVFIYVGVQPMTAPFKGLGILDEDGWIPTDELMHTKVPGIFAVGDVRKKNLRQIATAVGEGGTAAQQAFDYIQEINSKQNV
ncbi:thioredoxin-disulfide reductase [Pediococcus claussenii]|uniref:Thioredoxin reductase n=1 Tax=Pediococcus claussenii (strain ATCC BAA-344 / DSM 14800 / JCM 18046 / KCTC 3811 / LMG 21948 / P06) TaxID=701521 RepID=G8PC18_PEDCP|nr:thioredoxin-disulfide reductase [Pediococcus claussenii]AEV94837.1 thioredoxin-disulfide reductase [Pediococcus claussenii ATCC BAA-344]ANZ70034.1 thioredoxin-disulfide reductase [Pediococcus claussenii]ANZ71849.1 thioredoxin-disulfide reductase [Pediococcus claussenii]KRN21015.1 trxB protein [Pediococcus claussenii]